MGGILAVQVSANAAAFSTLLQREPGVLGVVVNINIPITIVRHHPINAINATTAAVSIVRGCAIAATHGERTNKGCAYRYERLEALYPPPKISIVSTEAHRLSLLLEGKTLRFDKTACYLISTKTIDTKRRLTISSQRRQLIRREGLLLRFLNQEKFRQHFKV